MLKSFFIAISAYSVIPAPRFDWTEENMRFSICFLPVIGVIEGIFLALWVYLCRAISSGNILFAAGAVILPVLVTGGLHMDGFCDTVDALASRRERDKMLEILKDPNAGAFAVIYCGVYLLACFGLYSELGRDGSIFTVSAGFTLSRSITALSTVIIPKARKTGFLAEFTKNTREKAVIAAMTSVIIICCAIMLTFGGISGILAVICAIACFFWYRHMSLCKFGGITGDTSGFFIQICEMSILFGAIAGVYAGRILP